ncbi:sulfotransferase family protein [Serinicoccus chungangensis]|uniref:sulfotransferase family protein n=1 Tax=Serinicoccus chungangensis TaxID=767452 RepID=UPI00130539CC|nr:sulfotransferase family protein [Serinicoccus chungangensis]
MKVIGASWGRTGTTSASAALDLLGFGPCVQMQTMWERPQLARAWAAHYRGEQADWEELLHCYGASLDWPGAWEWRRFADLWPDARVLLTLRDAESWYDSALGSIHSWTAPGQDVGPPAVAELLSRVWQEHFGGWHRFLNREQAIEAYEAHVIDVRRECPPERLIQWRVADGWMPLCEQLGVPTPDQPVPHLNSRTG